jgi:hypothetical protein
MESASPPRRPGRWTRATWRRAGIGAAIGLLIVISAVAWLPAVLRPSPPDVVWFDGLDLAHGPLSSVAERRASVRRIHSFEAVDAVCSEHGIVYLNGEPEHVDHGVVLSVFTPRDGEPDPVERVLRATGIPHGWTYTPTGRRSESGWWEFARVD